MSSVIVSGDTSGSISITAPLVAGSGVLTLPTGTDTLVGKATTDTLTNKTLTAPVLSGSLTGTYTLAGTGTLSSPIISGTPTGVGVLTSATAQASTSGTSIDFTGIPSWVKRITVMFNVVSTNGTSLPQIQIGSGSVTTSGYLWFGGYISTSSYAGASATSGFVVKSDAASSIMSGSVVLTTLGSNVWTATMSLGSITFATISVGAGGITLGGTLDRVRITTVNGTDTFDAGSINIMYE